MAISHGERDSLISRLVAAFTSVRNSLGFQHNNLSQLGIGRGGFMVLDYLEKEGPSKMSDIASALRVTSASITGITGNLVRDGHIRRLGEPHDRRVVMVENTDQGREKLNEVRRLRQERAAMVLSEIDENDLRQLAELIERVSQSAGSAKAISVDGIVEGNT